MYYQKSQTIRERTTDPMIRIREFHNGVKKMCYTKANTRVKGTTLLDIAGGRGGDISKYSAIECEDVTVVDIDQKGLDECRRRFTTWKRKYPFSINTLQGDMTLPGFGKNFKKEFPIIACHFAIHYAFSSEQDVNIFLQNVYDCLCTGGIFMVTMLDGKTLCDRQKDTLHFGLHTTISLPYKDRSDFGYPIDITIRSISDFPKREYLVDFEVLKRKASEYNLEVVETGMFSEVKDTLSDSEMEDTLSDSDLEYSSLHRWILFIKI